MVVSTANERGIPDWTHIHRELRRKSVTLTLLWYEYKEIHPEGYQYSQFCNLYRQWVKKLDVTLRQHHRAGEKTFVDYAGQTVEVVDRRSGEIRQAQIFVAVLGASNYTYAEASLSQSLPDWLGSHVRAFEYFGGTTAIVVPDNLKSGVTKACRYDPQLNASYQQLATQFPTSDLAPEALWSAARLRQGQDDYAAAADLYGDLIRSDFIIRGRRFTLRDDMDIKDFDDVIAQLRATTVEVVSQDGHHAVLDVCGVRENWRWDAFDGWEYDGPAEQPIAAPVDGDDAAGEVVIITVLEARLLHHVAQCLLVGMHPYGLGQITVAGFIPGDQPAQFRQDAEGIEIVGRFQCRRRA